MAANGAKHSPCRPFPLGGFPQICCFFLPWVFLVIMIAFMGVLTTCTWQILQHWTCSFGWTKGLGLGGMKTKITQDSDDRLDDTRCTHSAIEDTNQQTCVLIFQIFLPPSLPWEKIPFSSWVFAFLLWRCQVHTVNHEVSSLSEERCLGCNRDITSCYWS